MKKNTFIKSTCLLLSLFTITSCSKDPLKSMESKINNSSKEVGVVETTLTCLDGDKIVYNENRKITIETENSKSNGTISITISKYDSTGNYVTNTTSDSFFEIPTSSLIKFSLNKKNMGEYTLTSDSLKATVSKDAIKNILPLNSFSSSSEINLEFILTDDKISKFDCSYVSTEGFNVSIETNYYY